MKTKPRQDQHVTQQGGNDTMTRQQRQEQVRAIKVRLTGIILLILSVVGLSLFAYMKMEDGTALVVLFFMGLAMVLVPEQTKHTETHTRRKNNKEVA